MSPEQVCLWAIRSGRLYVDIARGTVTRSGQRVGTLSSRGYLVATVHADGLRKQIKFHRLVWVAAHGPVPAGFVLDHINRDKADNRIANLRLVNATENARNRRSYRGERNPAAKITKHVAGDIRRAYKSARSYRLTAQNFGVSKTLVAKIVRGELWA